MVARLSKARVERLLAAVDGPPAELAAEIEAAIRVVRGAGSAVDHLVALGRAEDARRFEAGDRDVLWDLAVELNELRMLTPGSDATPGELGPR